MLTGNEWIRCLSKECLMIQFKRSVQWIMLRDNRFFMVIRVSFQRRIQRDQRSLGCSAKWAKSSPNGIAVSGSVLKREAVVSSGSMVSFDRSWCLLPLSLLLRSPGAHGVEWLRDRRVKYWAIRSCVHSFARTAHSGALGQWPMSMSRMRPFHIVSTHCAVLA